MNYIMTCIDVLCSLDDGCDKSHALIIDGASLTYVLESQSNDFANMCSKASAVLCCRMSPLQKSQVRLNLPQIIIIMCL